MSLAVEAPHQSVRAKISSVGTYVPPRLLTNADLEKMVETNDQWITERTGIQASATSSTRVSRPAISPPKPPSVCLAQARH